MAGDDSVGKITLDLELGGDTEKQIEEISQKIGNQISKSLEGITSKIDFSSLTNSMTEAIKTSLNSIDNTIKSSIQKNKELVLKSIQEMKASALEAIKSIMNNAKKIRVPINFNPVQNINPTSTRTSSPPTTRGPPQPKVNSSVNLESVRAQIENLTNSLEITNRRIEQQQEKLAGLRQTYNSTFNQARKNRIQEQILKTETAINKLTAQSDKTGFKLADLDAEFERLSSAAQRSSNGVNSANNSIKRTASVAKSASRSLKSANNNTRRYRENMNGARSATGMFIDSMFKWGIVFPIVMKGISAVAGYIGNALMTNAQFANSLQQIRSNLIVAFMPIYQAVLPALNALMSALANVTAYIAAFVSALFGKTYQASFGAAKSMNASIASMQNMEKQGKKTSGAVDKIGDSAEKTKKKIKGALAGFDEINKLSLPKDTDKNKKPKTPKDGGGIDPIPMVAPNVDLSPASAAMKKINDMVAKLKGIISKVFQPFKVAWAREGAATIESIKYALHGIWYLIKSIGKSFLEVWTNGTGERILVVILQILQNIFNIIGDIATTFANAWNAGGVGTHIVQTLADAFINVLTLIKHMGDSLRDVWGEVGPGVAKTFMKVLDAISGVLKNTTKNLLYVWDNGGSHLFKGFVRLGAKIFELAGYIYTDFVAPFVMWFDDSIAPVIAKVADVVGTVLDAFSSLIDWLMGEGKPALDSMITTVTLFFAAWETMKLMSFIQQAGGVIGAVGSISKVLKECTLLKLADKLETIQLTAMYAGEFLASIGRGALELAGQAKQFAINIGMKIADKAETLALIGLYAGDFIVALATGTLELIKQAGQFVINTGLKIADTTAQIAMTAATVAWNSVCVIATGVTTALGVAIAFLTSPIGIAIVAIGAIIAIGVALYKNWDVIKVKAQVIWAKIKAIFYAFKVWLQSVFQRDWSKSFGALGNLLNAFLRNVSNIFGGIRRVFGGIIDFIAGVFTGNWSRAWNGVRNIFGGIFDTLGGIAKAPLNAVIGLINMCIDGLNTISFDAPSWIPGVGGKHFGVNIPKMTYLAKGGVVDRPTQAVVGEAGTEAVVPLENNTQGLDLLANKLTERINNILLTSSSLLQQPDLTMLGQNSNMDNKNINDSNYLDKLKEAIIEAIKESKDNKGAGISNSTDSKEFGDIILRINDTDFGKIAISAINKVHRQSGELLLEI
ncbi:hypothetical protein K5V21_13745 [Clostridium sardiniense]|uniref:Uncharacterized protein n=1 Tax=Clostridium sardiniense TaxID=29369 RepID=A0ABS7L0B6_CLOSR|nr:hypothetical protein [Clostridium sardiniense]MDQ0460255.1 phage-related minor tail protein/flagellar biosynthesis chaperone FliJ [Clostridium sardiniense]